jgi:hypothetical protein
VSDERQAIGMSFLEQAGALTGALGDQAEEWLALASVAVPVVPAGRGAFHATRVSR